MNLNSTLKSIEKKMQVHKIETWYEMDWSEWSEGDLRLLAENIHNVSEETYEYLLGKMKVKRAHSNLLVPKHTQSYLSIDQVKALQEFCPNVRL